MNWKDVGKTLATKGLPLLGTLIGGPIGGAVGVAGSLISSVLGVDNEPEAVMEAIKADPDGSIAKLVEMQERNKFELERMTIQAETTRMQQETERQKAVNASMQAESQSEDAWSRRWRPFWGFCSAIAWALMALAIAYDIAIGHSGTVVKELSNIPETFWLIPLTILGVASYHRGKEKRLRAGEATAPQPGGVLQKLSDKMFGGAK